MSEAPKQSIATTTTQMTQPDWMMNALQTGVNRAGEEMNRAPNSMYQSGMDNLMNVTNQWLNPSYNPTITQSPSGGAYSSGPMARQTFGGEFDADMYAPPTFGGGNANLPSGLSGTSGGNPADMEFDVSGTPWALPGAGGGGLSMLPGAPATGSNYFNLDPATKQYQDTLAGKYLYGGEGLEAAQNAAMNKITPQVTSAFNASGRMGGLAGQSELTSRVGDAFAGLFDNERNRMIQALGQTEAMERAAYAPQQHNIDNALLQLGQGLTEEQRLSGKVDDYLRQIQGPAQFVGGETKDVPIFEGGGSSTADILGAVLGSGGILSSLLGGGSGGGIDGIYQAAKKLFDDGSIGADVWDAVKKAFGFDDDGNITQIDPADFIGDTGNPANTVNTGPTTSGGNPDMEFDVSGTPWADIATNPLNPLGPGLADAAVNVAGLVPPVVGGGVGPLISLTNPATVGNFTPGFIESVANAGAVPGGLPGLGGGALPVAGAANVLGGTSTAAGTTALGLELGAPGVASATPGGGLLGGSLGTAIGAGLPLAMIGAGQAYSAHKDAENRAWAAPYFQAAQAGTITTTDGVRGIPIQFKGETFLASPAIQENPEVGIGGAESLIVYRPATGEYGSLGEPGHFTSDIQTTMNELEDYAQEHGGKIYTRDDITGSRIVRDPNNMSSFTMRSEADILKPQSLPGSQAREQEKAVAQQVLQTAPVNSREFNLAAQKIFAIEEEEQGNDAE